MRGGRTEATVVTRDATDRRPAADRAPPRRGDRAARRVPRRRLAPPGRRAARSSPTRGRGPTTTSAGARGARSRRARSPPTSARRSRPASCWSARSRRSPASPAPRRSPAAVRHLVPRAPRRRARKPNLAALDARAPTSVARHGRGDRARDATRGTVVMALDRCKGCGLCVPGVPPGRARDDRRAQRQGLRAAATARRLHRVSRVRRGVPRLRVRGVPVRSRRRTEAEVGE